MMNFRIAGNYKESMSLRQEISSATEAFESILTDLSGRVDALNTLTKLPMDRRELYESWLTELSAAESAVSNLETQIAAEKECIPEWDYLNKCAEKQAEYVESVLEALPEQVAKKVQKLLKTDDEDVPEEKSRSVKFMDTPAEADDDDDDAQEISTSNSPQPVLSKVDIKLRRIPAIQHISTSEMASVPGYMKGRLNAERVNTAIDDIQSVVVEKYRLLFTPMSQLHGKKQLNLVKRYKEDEVNETKGLYFFTEQDLRDCKSIKVDASGRALLQVLRHLRRLRDVRGGKIARYALL